MGPSVLLILKFSGTVFRVNIQYPMDVGAIMNTTRNQMIDFLAEDLVISGRSQVCCIYFLYNNNWFHEFFFNCIFLNFLAPTVLNMSPECSLSGPPSIRNANMNEVGQSEDIHGHLMHNGDELSGKSWSSKFVFFWSRCSVFEVQEARTLVIPDFGQCFGLY